MNKKLFTTLTVLVLSILLTFALTACGSDTAEQESTEPAQEETTAAAAAEWYDNILSDASGTKDYPYYRLLDIDQDGTDELFLSSTEKAFIGAEDKAKLMASVDGEAVTVKEIGGAGGESFSYDPADKALFYYWRLSGEEHIVKYGYENGALNELQTADEYDRNHDPETGDNVDDTYYLDGKKVTEAEADVLWDVFDDHTKAITYSTDGQGNPNAGGDADEPNDGDDNDDDD